jgi:REP element-mobilizing transposase RayT
VGAAIFVTFRLHGSLPASRHFPAQTVTGGKAFVSMDRILDEARTGPRFLSMPAIAELTIAAICREKHYELHAFVVMANHVHLLVTPHVPNPRWHGPLKGIVAYEANRILGRRGTPFWQDESYDHMVRSGDEFSRIRGYIENNPVKAGLVETAEQYPWSSACKNAAA